MEQFINKNDLIYSLQDLRINEECYLKVSKMINDLPTVGVERVSTKCGTCGNFERYNNIRGYCKEKKAYFGKNEYCDSWKDGSK